MDTRVTVPVGQAVSTHAHRHVPHTQLSVSLTPGLCCIRTHRTHPLNTQFTHDPRTWFTRATHTYVTHRGDFPTIPPLWPHLDSQPRLGTPWHSLLCCPEGNPGRLETALLSRDFSTSFPNDHPAPHTQAHAHTHAHVHPALDTHRHVCAHTATHASYSTRIGTCVHTHILLRTHTQAHVCTHAHPCTHTAVLPPCCSPFSLP